MSAPTIKARKESRFFSCARNGMFGKHGGRTRQMPKSLKCKAIALFVACVYTIFTLYALHVLVGNESKPRDPKRLVISSPSATNSRDVESKVTHQNTLEVEIWGKAAVGLYLWEHILEGPLEKRLGGVWSYGEKHIRNIKFKFRTGPGVVPDKVPKQTRNLVLVINGREPQKVDFAKAWLDSLADLPHLRNVAVVLLGNERCENDWLFSYMRKNGGLVQVAFIVYDIPYADSSTFYQWPLGVATYRNFPNIPFLSVDVQNRRKFRCNFLGTVYPNSSRVVLQTVIQQFKLDDVCFVKMRDSWSPGETAESANDFRYALANSDLTLNPVGMNTECYRIYEACSYGSVPVIEDIVTPGECRRGDKMSPLHLLKAFNAPFIYVKDWKELPRIIENEIRLTHQEVVERRQKVLSWYKTFKEAMRDKFVDVIQNKFSL